jgi:transcription-repair coupling factor (superfamily II helicase)
LLERAINALKSGQQPDLDQPLALGSEIDLGVPALIPDDYLPDVHARLVMYKRIASATDQRALDELQVEMIDRFGLLPETARNLMSVTALKLKAAPLGIRKIEAGAAGGRLIFGTKPNIDPDKIIVLIQNQPKVYKFDGKDKLRFMLPMEDENERFSVINDLLDKIK